MHQLIIGMTGSGKSTLAKLMIPRLKKRGFKTAILDPLGDPTFGADFSTQNSEDFLKYAKCNRDHFLFVDEGGISMGRYNQPMEWLATTARHCGHLCTFITQGATQLNPLVRGQCDRVFMFACSSGNGELLASEWNEPDLAKSDRLERFNFYIVSRFAKLQRGKILLDKGQIEYDNLSHVEEPLTK